MIGIFVFICFALLLHGLGGSYILRLIGLLIIGMALIILHAPPEPPTPAEKYEAFNNGWCAGYSWAVRQGNYGLLRDVVVDIGRPEWYRIDMGNNEFLECKRSAFQ